MVYTNDTETDWLFYSSLGAEGIYTNNIHLGLNLEGKYRGALLFKLKLHCALINFLEALFVYPQQKSKKIWKGIKSFSRVPKNPGQDQPKTEPYLKFNSLCVSSK